MEGLSQDELASIRIDLLKADKTLSKFLYENKMNQEKRHAANNIRTRIVFLMKMLDDKKFVVEHAIKYAVVLELVKEFLQKVKEDDNAI